MNTKLKLGFVTNAILYYLNKYFYIIKHEAILPTCVLYSAEFKGTLGAQFKSNMFVEQGLVVGVSNFLVGGGQERHPSEAPSPQSKLLLVPYP